MIYNQGLNLDLPSRAVPDRVSIAGKNGRLDPFEKRTFALLDGPGCIQHLWVTMTRQDTSNRKCLIRIYFDDSDVPQVEAPVGDFFGVMHGKAWYPVNTPFLSVMAESGYNCYFPMPFAKTARIEFEGGDEPHKIYLIVDWHRYPGQEMRENARFCARWRREMPAPKYGKDFLMADIEGSGHLAGFTYGVRLMDDTDRWSHGGADNIYIDGETSEPVYLRGIGGEDTFGTSYGGALHPARTHLYSAMPYYVHEDVGQARPAQRVVGYRFFDQDFIPFEKSLHLRFGCMANDICSTTYWYQKEPLRPFWTMPPCNLRLPGAELNAKDCDLALTEFGDWWLCGPFPAQEGPVAAETESFNPEQIFVVEHEEGSPWLSPRSREAGRNQARWQQAPAVHGFIDFNHYIRPIAKGVALTHPGIAVAFCVIESPEETDASLQISWDDQLFLRVNDGEMVSLGKHPAFRSKTVPVKLTKGENRILLKLTNEAGSNHGGWAFCFQCTTAGGTKLLPKA